MPHFGSFRKFLSDGTLGPLTTRLNSLEVSQLLGPPQAWGPGAGIHYPLVWVYSVEAKNSPLLEIGFRPEPPHQIQLLQIDAAHDMTGGALRFGDRLVVELEGIAGTTRPAEFLRSGIWDTSKVTVYFSTTELGLVIVASRVSIYFVIWESDDFDATQRSELLEAFAIDQRFLELERLYEIHSIVARTEEGPSYPGAYFDMKHCTGQEYLESLERRPG